MLSLFYVLLIPFFLSICSFPEATVGGIFLFWFSTWLEIVWLSLWAGRQKTLDGASICSSTEDTPRNGGSKLEYISESVISRTSRLG